MRTRTNASTWIGSLSLVGATVLSAVPSMAGGFVCEANAANDRRVCVGWSLGANPIHLTHFRVDYDCTGCSAAPDIELLVGDDEWQVESRSGVIGTGQVIADMGNLTAEAAGNYKVQIRSILAATSGAVNVKSINLNPTGDDHSSLRAGSRIFGDLQGSLFVKEDSAGAGGAVRLELFSGDVSGDIDAFDIADLDVGGDLNASVTAETITKLTVAQNLTGDVTATTITELTVSQDLTGDVTTETLGTANICGTVIGNFAAPAGSALTLTSLIVGGDLQGSITADTITSLDVGGVLDGSITAKTITSAGIDGMTGNIAAPVGSTLDISALSMQGDMSGNVTANSLSMNVLGTMSGDITATTCAGVTTNGPMSGNIYCGTVSGDFGIQGGFTGTSVDIDVWTGGSINTKGTFASSGTMTIGQIPIPAKSGAFVFLGVSDTGTFDGTVVFEEGLPGAVALTTHQAVNGTLDFNNKNVDATVTIDAGGSGTIKNIDTLTGDFSLTGSAGASDWSGTMTMTTLEGRITTPFGHALTEGGKIHVTGACTTTGIIDINSVLGVIQVDGDLSGEVSGSGIIGGPNGNGRVTIGGDVTSTGELNFFEITGNATNQGLLHVQGDVAGSVFFEIGIAQYGTLDIDGALQSGGQIDMNSGVVAGSLLIDGGGAGNIVNGGLVSGTVQLATGLYKSYAGNATFTDVSSTGTINTLANAMLNGDVTVSVSMAGLIDISGNIGRGGDVVLDGLLNSISGTVRCYDLVGRIALDGHLSISGFIDILGGMSGFAQITAQSGIAGDIRIGKSTGTNTQIILPDLASSSRITINYDQGDFDADGDITIGSGAPPATVTFDGAIRILTDGINGGDLGANATVLVQGCHATTDDLQIVVCGTQNGTVTLSQAGCANQVSDPSPDTCD